MAAPYLGLSYLRRLKSARAYIYKNLYYYLYRRTAFRYQQFMNLKQTECLRCAGLDETHDSGCLIRKLIFGEWQRHSSRDAMEMAVRAINSSRLVNNQVSEQDATRQLDTIVCLSTA